MDYKKLLSKAMGEIPESIKHKERFEIPKVSGHIEGNKTIINNFFDIIKAFNRDQEHLLKYILKELATPGEIRGNLLILGRKISSNIINEKIERYAAEFVICKECGKPDTQLNKKEKVLFLKCLACGAQHPVKSKL
jgi:translation initiation factor 2 subunit 2